MNWPAACFSMIFLAGLACTPAFGQSRAERIRSILRGSCWLMAPDPTADCGLKIAEKDIGEVYFFDMGSCVRDSACEIFMHCYELFQHRKDGPPAWEHVSCSPHIAIRKWLSADSLEVRHVSEEGDYTGVLTVTDSCVTFAGKDKEGRETREVYSRIKLPAALSEIPER